MEAQGTNDADVLMLGNFGTTASERTMPQLVALLAEAGLELVTSVKTRGEEVLAAAYVCVCRDSCMLRVLLNSARLVSVD